MGNSCSNQTTDIQTKFTDMRLMCNSEEVEEGGMKEVEVEGNKILLLRQGGVVRGLSGTCTHYGAPLVKGVLGANSITCPWHGACFNTTTGDIEDFPGLSSLVSFNILEKDGNIFIQGNSSDLEKKKRERGGEEILEDVDNDRTVVIVGGGAAGHTAIETFRAEGFDGKIILVSSDESLPYDRPKLSKKLDAKPSEIQLRPDTWYKDGGVKVMLGVEVVQVFPENKIVVTSSGERLKYDDLLFATGGSPRKLGVPGENLEGVKTLRRPPDANYISEAAAGKNVVIIGGSFIGLEVAAALVGSCNKVTVVDRNTVSFQNILGVEVGAILAKLHTDKGVLFEMEETVSEIQGTDGTVTGVILGSGKLLEADLVLIGAGVTPNTAPLDNIEGILDSRGILRVDEFMQSSVPQIWGAGDIVEFPLLTYSRQLINIGHWGIAMYMGKIAALNILGRKEPAYTVPFFWSVQYGKSVRFAGISKDCDSVKVEVEGESFLATYSIGGVVQGVATLGRDPVAAYFRTMVAQGKQIKEEEAFSILRTMPNLSSS